MCVGIADTNALVWRQWMGDLFYENMGNYPNTTIYRANKCWCEWVPNSESLLLLDNEMLKCTFIVIYVFSFVLSEKCLTGFTNLVIMLDNNHRSSTCRASLSRATVAVSETILVTLSTYRAVPALRTSLLVVSAHLHSRGWGVSEAGIGNPNLRKLPLFAHSHKLTVQLVRNSERSAH